MFNMFIISNQWLTRPGSLDLLMLRRLLTSRPRVMRHLYRWEFLNCLEGGRPISWQSFHPATDFGIGIYLLNHTILNIMLYFHNILWILSYYRESRFHVGLDFILSYHSVSDKKQSSQQT